MLLKWGQGCRQIALSPWRGAANQKRLRNTEKWNQCLKQCYSRMFKVLQWSDWRWSCCSEPCTPWQTGPGCSSPRSSCQHRGLRRWRRNCCWASTSWWPPERSELKNFDSSWIKDHVFVSNKSRSGRSFSPLVKMSNVKRNFDGSFFPFFFFILFVFDCDLVDCKPIR